MRPLPAVLLSVVVVVGGILVYDVVAGPPDPGPPSELPSSPAGATGDVARTLAEHERKLDALEATMDDLAAAVTRIERAAAEAAAGERPKTDDEPLDEDELAVLRIQMEEIERRREARRQAMMVARKLKMLGVAFTEAERAALQERMVAFQVDVAELWKRVREEAIDDRTWIASEYDLLRDAAIRDVRKLLPSEKAEAVVKGFLDAGPKAPK